MNSNRLALRISDLAVNAALKQLVAILLTCYTGGLILAFGAGLLRVNLFGFSSMDELRNGLAIGYYVVLSLLSVPSFRVLRPAFIIALPALTQYHNVVLGWDIATGAQSWIRVLPVVVAVCAMLPDVLTNRISLQDFRTSGLFFLVLVGLVGGISAFGVTSIWWTSILFYTVYFPLLGLYLLALKKSGDGAEALIAGGLVAAFTFVLGTIATVQMGSGLGLGSGQGLLSARSVSDFNLVMAYIFALIPFLFWWLRRQHVVVIAVVMALILLCTLLGLSRVGILLVPVLLLGGLFLALRDNPRKYMLSIGAWIVVMVCTVALYPGSMKLTEDLSRRFNVESLEQADGLLASLTPGGSEGQKRDILRDEALRIYSHEPAFGSGFGGYAARSAVGFADAHNLFHTTLAEFGWLGVLGIYSLLVTIGLRLIALANLKVGEFSIGWLFCLGFGAWVVVVHAVGGGFAVASDRSFSINVAGGTYLLLYLYPDMWLYKKNEISGMQE